MRAGVAGEGLMCSGALGGCHREARVVGEQQPRLLLGIRPCKVAKQRMAG
jgi:hypothetical protein